MFLLGHFFKEGKRLTYITILNTKYAKVRKGKTVTQIISVYYEMLHLQDFNYKTVRIISSGVWSAVFLDSRHGRCQNWVYPKYLNCSSVKGALDRINITMLCSVSKRCSESNNYYMVLLKPVVEVLALELNPCYGCLECHEIIQKSCSLQRIITHLLIS